MKDTYSVQQSADGAIKRSFRECRSILTSLDGLKQGKAPQDVMPKLRMQLLELQKAIHEYNAYRNVLETE